MPAASSCCLMVGQERRARAALLLMIMRSATSPSAARCERQLTCARHDINGARDLRIAVVEDLSRRSIPVSRGQQVVTQLSFGEGARFIELVRSHLENRLIRRKLFQLAEQRVRYGIISVRQVVIEFDCALDFVFLKSRNSSRRQLEREREENIAQVTFSRGDRAWLNHFVR